MALVDQAAMGSTDSITHLSPIRRKKLMLPMEMKKSLDPSQ